MSAGLNPDVIVIGAGAAGLSAAQSLRSQGLVVTVLEAAGHVGGRCVTDTKNFSVPFDRGGSWLHSAPINPLARIAEERDVALHKTPWAPVWARVDGHALSERDMAAYRTAQENVWPLVDQAGARAKDTPTGDALPSGPWARACAQHIPQMLGGDADVTSAMDSYNYADAAGDWLVAGGLGAFVQSLHADVPVQLNCRASKVDYRGAGVRVTTHQGVLAARCVVMTVSTGVLAAGHIAFDPPLPAAKHDALEMLPNGSLNKVGIEFAPDWRMAREGQSAEYLDTDDGFCSILFGFFGSPVATGFVAGRFADALEREGAGAATDYCLTALRAIFGADVTKSVVRTSETAWRANALTLGAYSYARPGGSPARAALAETLDDRLFFAGEATMTDTYSTVHGAYLSGKAAAARVISTLQVTA